MSIGNGHNHNGHNHNGHNHNGHNGNGHNLQTIQAKLDSLQRHCERLERQRNCNPLVRDLLIRALKKHISQVERQMERYQTAGEAV